MKFEYEEEKEDRKCVAYINGCGNLAILLDEGDQMAFMYRDENSFDKYDSISICNANTYWDPSRAIRKFYKGDKITITF